MVKKTYQFEDFLTEVEPDYIGFAVQVHESLLADGYKVRVESKANGFLVSYAHTKTKRSLLNFVFRKKRLQARIYPDNNGKYADFLDDLPKSMVGEIAKSSVCKRLINPADCNSRCVMGYDFFIQGERYQKCRYGCFQFDVNTESIPVLTEFIDMERREGLAQNVTKTL